MIHALITGQTRPVAVSCSCGWTAEHAGWDGLADYYTHIGHPHTRPAESTDWPTYAQPVTA